MRQNIKLILIALCILILHSGSLFSQNSIKAKASSAMTQFLSDEQNQYALASLTVINAETGEEVYQHNGNIGLASASTLKVLTASTAYALLGEGYTYKTELLYSGQVKNDTLYGDLIIKGGGDPSLGSWRYDESKPKVILHDWLAAIQNKSIKYIKGQIIGDADVFDTQNIPDGWPWEDLGNYYGAGASGLTWHENQYDLFLNPGIREGEKVQILRTEPAIEDLRFINELKTGKSNSGDQVYIYAASYRPDVFVRGSAPANHSDFKVKGAIPDPALTAARVLESELNAQGIKVDRGAVTTHILRRDSLSWQPEEKTTLLHTHESPKLSELSHWFLKKSINLYGEHFLKTLALEEGEGNSENGLKVIKEFWENRGIDQESMHIMDGSGLSPGNRITTRTLAKVLVEARQADWFPEFYENLPTIHNIKMKSGHIGEVAAYAGYIKSVSGETLIFSFIVNNYSGKIRTLTPKIFKLLDSLKV